MPEETVSPTPAAPGAGKDPASADVRHASEEEDNNTAPNAKPKEYMPPKR